MKLCDVYFIGYAEILGDSFEFVHWICCNSFIQMNISDTTNSGTALMFTRVVYRQLKNCKTTVKLG